ncbi:MAG: LysR family transcriptional regulator [Chloroflexi bacterium]|nr:LysR family transcriptional regulator [Chloroflexota bacterium]
MTTSSPKHRPEERARPAANIGLPLEGDVSVHARAWIEAGARTYLGYGRVVLLERIDEHGSISAAARSMGMSYRHAWDLVESMNHLGGVPLVQTATGGSGGGGARLTEAGRAAVRLFRRLDGKLQEFRQEIAAELAELRARPEATDRRAEAK